MMTELEQLALNRGVDLLYKYRTPIQNTAFELKYMLGKNPADAFVFCAIYANPWNDFLLGFVPETGQEVADIQDQDQRAVVICGVETKIFAGFCKGWETPDLSIPDRPLPEEHVWLLTLHELGYHWFPILPVPPKNSQS